MTTVNKPTFEECLDAAYAEYVRGWYDTHPGMLEASPEVPTDTTSAR